MPLTPILAAPAGAVFSIFPVLAGLALLLWMSSRRGGPRRVLRRRPVVVRIVCAAMGAGLLMAVGIGSWQQAHGVYAERDAAEPLTIAVPAGPPPEVPAIPEGEAEVAMEKARLLLAFVVLDFAGGTPEGVYVQQKVLDWPTTSRFKGRTVIDGARIDCEMNIYQVVCTYRDRWHKTGPACIAVRSSTEVEVTTGHRMSGGSGPADFVEIESAGGLSIWPGCRAKPGWFSVVGGRTRLLYGFWVVYPLTADDAMKRIPLADWAAEQQEALSKLVPKVEDRMAQFVDYPDGDAPPGLALAGQAGFSSLGLLVAAILLSQLFRRRGMGFALVLALLVLYVAGLDRLALGVHLDKLSDGDAPTGVRVRGCAQAMDTFFYRQTAIHSMEEAARDASAPEMLRTTARAGADALREPLYR